MKKDFKIQVSEGLEKVKPFFKQMIDKYGPLFVQYVGNYLLAKKAIDNGCDVSTSISNEGINLKITSDE